MNKLALALALSAVGATAGSAQLVSINTGASIVDRLQGNGTWRREGNTDIYTRVRIDANGNRVIDRARRDALGNYIIVDSRVVARGENRGRTDNTWKRSNNPNRVYVRRRIDANGNVVLEKARRDANGNYIVFESKVVGSRGMKDRDRDGRDDRWEKDGARGHQGKWKKDKDGKRWERGLRKGHGKEKEHGREKEKEHEKDDHK